MEIFFYTFFQHALAGVLLISIVSAIIGTYIVTRRMVFISGGITHACFGGLGLGYYLGISPIATAALFAIGGALGVDRLAQGRVRRDSAIAVIWASGMALGVFFIFMTDGYVPELNTFLFGNVLTVTTTDIIVYSIFTAILLLFYIVFFRIIVAVSFDADFAKTRYLHVRFTETCMSILVAVAIVLTIRMIGIMLLISLFSLPQMTAENFTRNYLRLILLSLLFSSIGCVGGLLTAYFISVPASATIIILMLLFYGLSNAVTYRNGRRRVRSSSAMTP